MTFKLTHRHRYWWPVTISIPHPDRAGKWLVQDFEVQFEQIPRDEADALLKEISEAPADASRDPNGELLARAVRDWKGVVGDDGEPVPFSTATLDQVMQSSWFRLGLTEAWNESLLPGRARAKN